MSIFAADLLIGSHHGLGDPSPPSQQITHPDELCQNLCHGAAGMDSGPAKGSSAAPVRLKVTSFLLFSMHTVV